MQSVDRAGPDVRECYQRDLLNKRQTAEQTGLNETVHLELIHRPC